MKPAIAFLSFAIIFSVLAAVALAPDLVTFDQSPFTAWWNDTIIINGSARYNNNTGIYNANLNISVGNVKCNNTTDSTGNYTCRFAAPQEVGTYSILINVTNSTGQSFTNTTTLKVRFKYGDTPSGTIDRVVYEVPIFIQEMSGRIRILFARVTVWRT